MWMLVRDLIDYLLAEVGAGRLAGSDKVPAELIRLIDDGHLDVTKYLAGKFNIKEGVGSIGQDSPD